MMKQVTLKAMEKLEFSTASGARYLLDPGNGTVIPLNSILAKIISLLPLRESELFDTLKSKFNQHHLKSCINFVERWSRLYDGLTPYPTTSKIDTIDGEAIKDYLIGGNIFQLILNLTDNCNMRCRYCYQSSLYQYSRQKSNKGTSKNQSRSS